MRAEPAESTELVSVIQNDHWRVGVLPGTGACLAFGQVWLDGRWQDLLRPTPAAELREYPQCGSYVLAPFSNRVRDGVLRFHGRSWQLRRNSPDGTAMHGIAHEHPWDVAARDAASISMAFDAAAVVGANFPWTFAVRVTYALEGAGLTVRTELTNSDVTPFPAGFGHHPFFRRGIVDPEVSEVRLRLPFEAAFPLRGGMAVGPAGPVPEHADHRELRPLGARFIDECLTGRCGVEPVRMVWPDSGVAVSLHADEIFSHAVLYAPEGTSFFAVEPVTNANDGFALMADGVPGHGVFVLAPGETRSGAFRLEVEVPTSSR